MRLIAITLLMFSAALYAQRHNYKTIFERGNRNRQRTKKPLPTTRFWQRIFLQ
jgi:hypothetical protein